MRGPARRGFRVQEHHRGLLGADRDLVWRVGGRDHLRSDVLGAVPIEHRQCRGCGDDLNGMVGVGIGGADRSGEGQHARAQ